MSDDSMEMGPGERCGVLLPVPLGKVYDYKVPPGLSLRPGDFVRVPLGPRKLIGVVWGEGAGDVADSKLRAVFEKLPAPPMSEVSRKFVDWVASYTLSSQGAVLKMAMSVTDAIEPPKGVKAYRVADPLPDIKMTKTRESVLKVLKDGPPLTASEAALEAGCSPAVVAGLAKQGALVEAQQVRPQHFDRPDPDKAGPELSPAQKYAADQMAAKVGRERYTSMLLDGVPGSGKTEVYFEAVAEAVRQGKQVLVLLPEIALGSQWLARFEKRFDARPAQWHSDLGQRERRETWRAVADGRASVVVGARSALFLPYKDLALIVVDEEHDPAFKQEEGVIYHARDMAVVRGHLGKIPVCLASATPSLESVINAQTGKYALLHLPERHGGAVLPELDLIDMRKEKLPATRWLSPSLQEALTQTFEAGQQAMLFLNRRGYAPLTLCRTCGFRMKCPNCSAWLVEHRVRGRLQCHHCGHNIQMPTQCPECSCEGTFAACGPGVERLAEEAMNTFPDARLAMASSDTITGPMAAQALVEKIERHDVDLIIGTQLVAKGYHFPLLTLVGVVDGDLGLAGGDLRAAERTYQLLYQVAGRAGRGDKPGRVLVQTFQPDHAVMQAMKSGVRDSFIAEEIRAREELSMPPFGRLVSLIVSGKNVIDVENQAANLARSAPRYDGVQVLGPAPAPLAQLRGKFRHRLLMKLESGVAPQKIVSEWLGRVTRVKGARIQIDVDPQSFL
ncbi:primosomal protein N' [Magnetovibrio sp. PR-2]|uniref:primosomal protein N' n=1 Tax=Magnetovibrio sp. PR-2 TaxID=3120356 RepID=UPI002FCDF145